MGVYKEEGAKNLLTGTQWKVNGNKLQQEKF